MKILFTLLMLLFCLILKAQKQSPQKITSTHLSETIDYWIYDLNPQVVEKNIYYLTDGQKMQENGMLEVLKKQTKQGKIPAAYYVFVSTIDAKTKEDKRNTYFFCNEHYLHFFEQELIPLVEQQIGCKFNTENRGLIGVSFGGLNAAYFTTKATSFKHYALLSPITYPCPKLNQALIFSENENLNIFISTGKQDAESYVVGLESLYRSKEFRVYLHQTEGGHDFENWSGQLEDCLLFFVEKK